MKSVCSQCIGEPSLANYISLYADEYECTYCGHSWSTTRALDLDQLLAHIRERIEVHYEDAVNSVGYDSGEGGYLLPTMDSHDLLEEVGLAEYLNGNSLQDDIAAEFMETPWVHKNPYSLPEEQERRADWNEFVRQIKHEVRYLLFPPYERGQFDTGTDPSEMLDELGKLFHIHELTSALPADNELVRVRVHAAGESPANTAAQYGPPPVDKARFSNRMSPAGVSMFYVALDDATALAESYVRHDGQPAEATIAVFRITEDLKVLNLVDLPQIPSLFAGDEENGDRPTIAFLHEFNRDFTRPVEKNGREHIDYVPSQVVTEYVRYRLMQATGHRVDGILYRSARIEEGIGCVLFYSHNDFHQDEQLPPAIRTECPFEFLPDRTRTVSVDTKG